MKSSVQIKTILKTLIGVSIKRPYYRFLNMDFKQNPLSTIESLNGGRYNFLKKFEVLYMSPDRTIVIKETERNII